jgi:DNA-directed RNA polymerase specialized sigma24 family protein
VDPASAERSFTRGRAEGGRDPDPGFSPETLAALAQLPHNQREALLLMHVHERSHAEAAVIVGSTAGAIELRAHRACVALRGLLGPREEHGA